MQQTTAPARAIDSPASTTSVQATDRAVPLRLAYLTTEYPKVSHTFIRREILELERRGHHILRLAIRESGGAIADPVDRDEATKTIHCLSQPWWSLLTRTVTAGIVQPIKWLRALRMTLSMSRGSDRGVLRHLAYLVEAASFLPILRRNRIDHVHVHFGTNAATVARLIYCLGGPTYSLTIHGPSEFDSPRGFSLGEKVQDAMFTIAISTYGTGQIRRWAPPESWDRIHVVRCNVGPQFFAEAQPVDEASTQFTCVGRLTPQKGQVLLLDAVDILVREGEQVHVVLAGDGELRPLLEERIRKAGLQSHVTITGWISEAEVRKHVLASRALVLPSFAEGLPVVIMEALALSRPVITTTIAGIPELVRHNESGWLVTSGSTEELTTAMRAALHTPAARLTEMGLAGQNRVRTEHDTGGEVAKLDALFRQYVQGGTA